MYRGTTHPWLPFTAFTTVGLPDSTITSATAGLSIVLERMDLASITLTPGNASGPTDWEDGKLWPSPLADGNYRIGIATSAISGITGMVRIVGSYTGGKLAGPWVEISAYDTATSPNTTTPDNTTIGLIYTVVQAITTSVAALPVDVRNAILNRVVAGNHDTAGTVGLLLQYLNATISSRQSATATVEIDFTELRSELGLATSDIDDQFDAILAAFGTGLSNSYPTIERAAGESTPITFSWPRHPALDTDIVVTVSVDDAAYVAAEGVVEYLRDEESTHLYTLTLDSAEVPQTSGVTRYRLEESGYDPVYLTLRRTGYAIVSGAEVVQIASPNVNGNLVLTQGDTYDGATGSNPKASWTVATDYTSGWVVTLTIRDADDAVVYTTTGTVDSTTVISVAITAPTGLEMTGLPGQWQGKFDVQLTKSTSIKTIVLGVCYINEDQTRS